MKCRKKVLESPPILLTIPEPMRTDILQVLKQGLQEARLLLAGYEEERQERASWVPPPRVIETRSATPYHGERDAQILYEIIDEVVDQMERGEAVVSTHLVVAFANSAPEVARTSVATCFNYTCLEKKLNRFIERSGLLAEQKGAINGGEIRPAQLGEA